MTRKGAQDLHILKGVNGVLKPVSGAVDHVLISTKQPPRQISRLALLLSVQNRSKGQTPATLHAACSVWNSYVVLSLSATSYVISLLGC
jgi:hypothetical protein